MAPVDAILSAPFKYGMLGNHDTAVDDADQVRQLLDLDDPTCPVGHAVVVSTNRHEPVMADPPLKLQHRIEAVLRQALQFVLFFGKGFSDHALGRAMDPCIGDRVEPDDELGIEVLHGAEGSPQEEVLTDVTERPLDFPFGLGAIGPARPRLEAVMLRQRQQRAVVNDMTLVIFAGHCRLHSIIEDLDRRAVHRLERLHMAAQQRLQILMQHIAGEQKARVAQHHAEQPDDARHARLVGKLNNEAREVDLALDAGPGLEADLVRSDIMFGPDRRQIALHRRVGAHVAHFPDLAGQARRRQVGERFYALAQELHVRGDLTRPPYSPWAVGRRFHTALDILANSLGIAACAAGNRSYRQPLPVQLQYHHGFSKSDHRRRLLSGDLLAPIFAFPKEPGLTPALWETRTNNQGIFKAHFCGELHAH